MARRPSLEVWLHGHRVARLSEPSPFRYRLDVTEEALDLYGEGSRVLSLGLPLTSKGLTDTGSALDQRRVSAFLEGLLPEGAVRARLAAEEGISTADKLALFARVGGECAGAVQLLPEGRAPADGSLVPLTPADLDRAVADLPTFDLPDGASLQASLAGIQDKILLTRRDDNSWALPQGGAMSSHLVKPEPRAGATVRHLVQLEHWTLSVARAAGIPAARSELRTFGDRVAIVVERYDRTASGRLHQEDFCQALGLPPEAKYESLTEAERSGTRLSRLCRVAADRSADPDAFRRDLLTLVTFNAVIGNGDAHSKNYSLLLAPDGEVTLAPLYDTAALMYAHPRFNGLGHVVNGRTHIDWLTIDDLVAEARGWGLAPRRARATIDATLQAVLTAVRTTDLPAGVDDLRPTLEARWRERGWKALG